MTIKQIADSVGKSERAVHYWAEKTSAKIAQVSAKIAQAKSISKPADFDLEETLTIIESGMGKNASDVYRASAYQADIVEKLASKVLAIVSPANQQIMQVKTGKTRLYGKSYSEGMQLIADVEKWPLGAMDFRKMIMSLEASFSEFEKARYEVGLMPFHGSPVAWLHDDVVRCWRYLCNKRGW